MMQPPLFPGPDAAGSAPDPAARLLSVVEGLDLASADGRAGIGALLAEIERLSPGAILRQAATIELGRVGWRRAASRPDDADGRSAAERHGPA